MPKSESLTNQLMLSPMVENNTDNHRLLLQFQLIIRETTTGISAEEEIDRTYVSPNIKPL